MDVEDRDRTVSTLAKLELVKEIRSKTMQMLKLKERLFDEVETSRKEERYLVDYRAEMDMLLQEKMSHVEVLRQVHADINQMETIIKQAEQSRIRSIETAKRLHAEFGPVKAEVDRLRQSCLGLPILPELHEEEPSIMGSEIFDQMPSWVQTREDVMPSVSFQQQSQAPQQAAAAAFLMSQNSLAMMQSAPKPERPPPHMPPPHPTGPTPSFRQQPPPMKSCLSCHQQIHRNAPICPLCKAKSRSRNPKKPKKKD